MPVVLLIVAAAILGGVVLASLGRVGEMADFASDTAPIELDEVSATDVALLRPPMSLWGYNAQATEDALRMIARSVTARDVEIATLRRELADLRGGPDGALATRPGDRPPGQASTPGRAGPPRPVGRAGQARYAGQAGPSGGDAGHAGTPGAGRPDSQAGHAGTPGAGWPGDEAGHSGSPGAGQPGGQAGHAGPAGPLGEAGPPGQAGGLPPWPRMREPGSDE